MDVYTHTIHTAAMHVYTHTVHAHTLTWQVVGVATIQQEVTVHWVAQRGEVAGERHASTHIVPQTAHPVDLHLGVCDVSGDAEVWEPQVLDGW